MDGEVKQGRFQGRRLKDLDLTALLAFLQEVSADQDSVGLVEAYLDRTHPDWRETAGSGESSAANPPSSSTMTAEEAYRILGLKPGAGNDDIKAAYRRLMGQLHPDHGGSDYLAAKVNQAKDFLLKH
jgi:DnaJ-domain-containing protein 1